MLKKAILTVLKDKHGDDGNEVNPYGENYTATFGPDFKVTLYAAFANPKEFLGSDIILPLYKLTKEHELPFFDMKIRYSRADELDYPTTSERFDSSFVSSCLKQNENLEKIFVCGPPVMNKDIPQHFSKLGLSKDKVVLM